MSSGAGLSAKGLEASQMKATLASEIVRKLDSLPNHEETLRILRLEVPMYPLDPLRWLQAQSHPQKIYWRDRDGKLEIAGVGEADMLWGEASKSGPPALFGQLSHRLFRSRSEARYFGGIRFSELGPVDASWQSFGSYRFVLPRFELYRNNGTHRLACNLLLPRGKPELLQETLTHLDRLVFAEPEGHPGLSSLRSRRDIPDHSDWEKNIASALQSFERGDLKKIVLARKSTLEFQEELNPLVLLEQLKKATLDCFHFCFFSGAGRAFIGASPERLYQRSGSSLRTEAIAGTRPRGLQREKRRCFGATTPGQCQGFTRTSGWWSKASGRTWSLSATPSR